MLGIGITTRNRPKVLKMCLDHFYAFLPANCKIVIIDDASQNWLENQEIVESFSKSTKLNANIIYRYNHERLGIAGSKNACLWLLNDCDNVFLFDDDAWPQKQNWDELWLNAVREQNVGHSLFCMPVSYIRETERIGKLAAYNNCLGVVMQFSRECLNRLGAYDTRGTFYGFEHAQMSRRACAAGFTRGNNYLSPFEAPNWIYTLDLHFGWQNLQPPLDQWNEPLASSVTKEEAQDGAQNNIFLLEKPPIFIPLKGYQI